MQTGLSFPLLPPLVSNVGTNFLELISISPTVGVLLFWRRKDEFDDGDKVVPAAEEHDGEGEEDRKQE
jgi:hypothetical protein